MTLPDKLTISRIFLTFVFMLFLFMHGILAKSFALVTFLIASVTDYLDGLIAKEMNISTDFGKLMDPIADKILVLAAFLAFVEMEIIPAWMVVVIILREITITGLRVLAATKGKVIPADDGGKQKMVSQVIVILATLVFIVLKEAGVYSPLYKNAIYILMFITVVLTVISGVSYLVKNKGVYSNAKTN